MKNKMNLSITFKGLNAFTAIFLLFFQPTLSSQTIIIKGVVKDEQTLKPIPDVNIKIFGTTIGTATDNNGRFSIKFDKFPTILIFSCIAYEEENYKITELPKNQLEFLLRSRSYPLKEVNVTSQNYSFLFKNQDYSVLDYELMGDNVLLLIFRARLTKSEMVLLNRSGDTLVVSSMPDVPPSRLYKDFLSNIHYISKTDYAYQVVYNMNDKTIDIPYRTTIDSLERIVKPFIFQISNRLYFQEIQVNGLGMAIGFYQKGIGKKYIRKYFNEKKSSEKMDDQIFYDKWNGLIGSQIPSGDENGDLAAADVGKSPKLGQYMNNFDERAYQFEFYNMRFPVIKVADDKIAFFNFGDDVLEMMDINGKTRKIIPITFHKESVPKFDTLSSVRLSDSGWRWGNAILEDEFNHNVYATYSKNGMIRINRINLETGKIMRGTVIPILFPEKMEIYDGEVYFLNRGKDENWKLAKCTL